MSLDLETVLNEEQRKAVLDTEGPVLVLAGAGSGKTRVLTYRVAHLVEMGVSAYSILAITFTNKATSEMKQRLVTLLGEDNGVWVSTFHSLCASILRRDADKLGYERNFSIYDETDSNRILRKVLKEKHLEESKMRDRFIDYISEAKNKGYSPEQYYADINGVVEDAALIVEVFERYEELLKIANAMDFDDLLFKTKRLLTDFPDVLARYQMKFRYIHVDEFQDTNAVQYELVRMLSEKWGNLFVVGDDDQSIYGWRGAVVGNILHFDKDYPQAKVYKLERNYRSTPQILEVANRVIANNADRHQKTLRTLKNDGVRVEFFAAYNDRQEAEWVLEQILAMKRIHGYRNRDFAILVRANSLTRTIESALGGARLNYRMLGGFKFFDRKEVQDVIAYLRAVSNRHDTEALERIINFPTRGIGAATIEKLTEFARTNRVELIDLLLDGGKGVLSAGAQKRVEEFGTLLSDLICKRTMPLGDYVQYLIERVGFKEYYEKTGKEEEIARYENVVEFLSHVREYEKQNPGASVDAFLETVRLTPEREEEIYDGETVTLATMHAVKGLEFRVVFIVGCEEGVFPSARAVRENASAIEEERRIMYVAITRARERLFISCAQNRFRFNRLEHMIPSRFFAEAKGEAEQQGAYQVYSARRQMLDAITRLDRPTYAHEEERQIVTPARFGRETTAPRPMPQPVQRDTSQFASGGKVEHPTYGVGTIIAISGMGKDKIAMVAFPKLGVKKFVLAVANLKLL